MFYEGHLSRMEQFHKELVYKPQGMNIKQQISLQDGSFYCNSRLFVTVDQNIKATHSFFVL